MATSLSGQAVPGIVAAPKKDGPSYEAASKLIEAIGTFGGIDAALASPYEDEPDFGSFMGDSGHPIGPYTIIIRIGTKP